MQALRIGFPVGRQLKQNRPQLGSQCFGPLKKLVQGGSIGLELFHMGDIAAGLEGKHEVVGAYIPPLGYGFESRQLIETAVDFHSLQLPGIIAEPIGFFYTYRIKSTLPVRVMPSRCTDVQVGRHLRPVACRSRRAS